jgi:hypothetical protein
MYLVKHDRGAVDLNLNILDIIRVCMQYLGTLSGISESQCRRQYPNHQQIRR